MVRTSLSVLLLGATLFVACKRAEEEPPTYAPAGAAPEAPPTSLEQAGPAEEGPAFSSVEEAQAALARAEQDLLTLAPPPPSAGAAAAPAPTTPAPAEGERATEPKAAAAPERKEDKAGAERCSGLCRAFGSLSRAADAICRLAGEADERCTHARASVRDNFKRISVCRCPAP